MERITLRIFKPINKETSEEIPNAIFQSIYEKVFKEIAQMFPRRNAEEINCCKKFKGRFKKKLWKKYPKLLWNKFSN